MCILCRIICSDLIVLQINLNDITKRPLRLTAQANNAKLSNLKLIGEELWHCNITGITVYDCQWNALREINLGRWTATVAALDTNTVVIATDKDLVTSSISGMHVLLLIYAYFVGFTLFGRKAFYS